MSIKLVTRSATLAETAAGFDSQEVTLSADGNYVVYQSSSTDLVSNQVDNNNHTDIFLFNATNNVNVLVSGAEGSGTETANAPSFQAAPLAISAHGRFVAFKSFATNLIPGQIDTNNNGDLFLFDRDSAANRLRLISHSRGADNTAATGGTAASEIPVINVDLANDESTGDGLFVAFQSTATDLVTGVTDNGSTRDLFTYDVSTGVNTLVTHVASSLTAPATSLVPGAVENGPGRSPVLSSNGRFLAYSSPANNLVANQQDSVLLVTNDVFLYDRTTRLNTLVSGARGSANETGVAAANVNGISADGSIVVFSSDSSDLIDADSNSKQDVFLSIPPLSVTFLGKPFDLTSRSELNVEDGVLDALFTVSRTPGQTVRDITSLQLVRGDGLTWSTTPTAGEMVLGVASNF